MVPQAGTRSDHVEDLHYLGPKAPSKLAIASERIFTCHPALLVGGGSERKIGGAEDPVICLDAIPASEDVRKVRAHLPIDDDGTLEAEADTCGSG